MVVLETYCVVSTKDMGLMSLVLWWTKAPGNVESSAPREGDLGPSMVSIDASYIDAAISMH
jgi:hypothetical protein